MGCLLPIILFISTVLQREVGCAHVLLTLALKRKKKIIHTIQVTYSNENLIFPTSLRTLNSERNRKTNNYIDSEQLYTHTNLCIKNCGQLLTVEM